MRFKNRFELYGKLYLRRALAYLIDYTIINTAYILLDIVIINSIIRLTGNNLYISFQNYDTASYILFIMSYMSYFVLSFYLYKGQTFGLTFFKIQVRRSGFKAINLNLNNCFNRALANYFSHQMFFIPFLILIFSKNYKNVPDILSKTQICYFNDDNHFQNDSEENIYQISKEKIAA